MWQNRYDMDMRTKIKTDKNQKIKIQKQKNVSLRKVMLLGFGILYSAIFILLLIMDISVISSHRSDVFQKWDDRNSSYTEAIADVVEEVNVSMYATYAYDQNFAALKTAKGIET